MKHKDVRPGAHYILDGTYFLHGARYSNLRVTAVRKGENRILVQALRLEKWVNPKALRRE